MSAFDLASAPVHPALRGSLQHRLPICTGIRGAPVTGRRHTPVLPILQRLILCVMNKHPNPRSYQLAVMEPHLPLVQLHDSTGKFIFENIV